MNFRVIKKPAFWLALAFSLLIAAPGRAQVACWCECTYTDANGKQTVAPPGCAQTKEQCTNDCKNPIAGFPKCSPPKNNACGAPANPTPLPLPLGAISPAKAIGTVIRVLLGLTGSLALVMFIYGGFLYMTSAGNEERVTKGKNTLVWAILGLIAVFAAYSVVNFVVSKLTA